MSSSVIVSLVVRIRVRAPGGSVLPEQVPLVNFRHYFLTNSSFLHFVLLCEMIRNVLFNDLNIALINASRATDTCIGRRVAPSYIGLFSHIPRAPNSAI